MSQELVPVLDDVYSRPLELTDFYVSNIGDRRHTAALVKILTSHHPLGQYHHLKRVQNTKNKDGALQILLHPAESPNGNGDTDSRVFAAATVESILKSADLPVTSLSKPFLVKVPSHPPVTRRQFEEASLYWPVTFHEDKLISQLLSGQFFSEEEVNKIQSYCQLAEAMRNCAADKGQEPIGIVIVDPRRDVIIAKGHDLRNGGNHLLHAVMVGVDLVARSQGGGMWPLKDADFYVISEEQTDNSRVLPVVSQSDNNGREKVGPYLCTAYDVYVTQEPCTMCCMALVHSRVGRVIYVRSHPDGGLGSRYKIHVQQGLNHHFSVFQYVGSLQSQSTHQSAA